MTIPLHHAASPLQRKEDTNEPARTMSAALAEKKEHQCRGKKGGQEEHKQPQGGGRKKGFGDGNALTVAGFEGGDMVYRALQLLGEVLAQLAIVGMNNRCLREREVERRRWRYCLQ